jgi:hypothetical protein
LYDVNHSRLNAQDYVQNNPTDREGWVSTAALQGVLWFVAMRRDLVLCCATTAALLLKET